MFNAFFQSKKGLPALSAVLAMGYLSCVSFPLIFAKGPEKSQTKPLQIAMPVQSSKEQPPDYLQISDWHLFGQAAVGFSSDNERVQETQLQLKLLGVLATSKHINHAHAIIATPDQIQKTYKINDALPGGAALKAIENDKIIILKNNQQESLSLERHETE